MSVKWKKDGTNEDTTYTLELGSLDCIWAHSVIGVDKWKLDKNNKFVITKWWVFVEVHTTTNTNPKKFNTLDQAKEYAETEAFERLDLLMFRVSKIMHKLR